MDFHFDQNLKNLSRDQLLRDIPPRLRILSLSLYSLASLVFSAYEDTVVLPPPTTEKLF